MIEKEVDGVKIQTLTGRTAIRYGLQVANKNSDYLCVCFIGSEEEQRLYLKEERNHTLFVMPPNQDDGKPQLTMVNYEKCVNELVEKTAEKLKINRKNILVFGYDEAATMALYFTMYFHYNHAIIGDPVVMAKYYIFQQNPLKPRLKTETRIDKMFQKMYIDNFNQPNIHFYSGSNSQNYEKEVKYLIQVLQEKAILKSIERKRNVGVKGYPSFMTKHKNILMNQLTCEEVIAWQYGHKVLAECLLPEYLQNDKTIQYAFYFYQIGKNDASHKTKYQDSAQYRFVADEGGSYFVKVFIRRGREKMTQNSSKFRITIVEDF
ncbi:hypothetical protein [Listeria booriae]|uniref:hypothetical protein n=1 Tax=Listeria booriae TaxID=1552123 RepID=UPI00162A9B99|nr:hypothetical protein [Listeria booriae]MBC2322064.1 hypothetical protein [Listeria booriae]MBC2390712.1 hypothetical protein [Listeria booriae]MCD2205422.1 hypothetical protein [Listeria booriae]